MNSPQVQFLSVQPMVDLLTAPYRRGAETLVVPLGPDGPKGTQVLTYDFKEYRARYGADPAEPKYIFFLKKDTGVDPLRIEAKFHFEEAHSTLTNTIGAAAATISVTSPSGFPGTLPFRIRINDELLDVTAVVGGSWTVARGAEGTTPVQHLAGESVASVRYVQTALAAIATQTDVTITVVSSAGFPSGVPFQIVIESEIMIVAAISANLWTVVRGVNGTAPSPHAAGVAVFHNTSEVRIPVKTRAGTSFIIPTPPKADALLRLFRIRQDPLPLSGAGQDNFGILALLGNISKLVWLLGWEKDQIRQHLRDVQQQRHWSLAHGFSLDLLGSDLRAPRFPPREHSPDSDTISLYHLSDDFVTKLAAKVAVADTTITVTSNFGFPFSLPFRIQIEAEILNVTAIAADVWTVGRGVSGTVSAPHEVGQRVTYKSDGGEVADEVKRLGLPGHPGTNKGAQNGVTGKFAAGFGFPGAAGTGFIEIASHADFDLPINRSFTAEAFVNTEAPARTTITAATNATATAITVASVFGFPAVPFTVQLENEILGVTGVANNVLTVVRGTGGTIAASHSSNTAVIDITPRVVLAKGQHTAGGDLAGTGWSLALLGGKRGFNNNARWTVREGANVVNLFADLDLADGRFHHLAALVDRDSKKARLFVDGEERASAEIGVFGAISNADAIRVGNSSAGHQFAGVIDEVRLSKVARKDFNPVLGEGDEAYRQRLGLFGRWLLPTPDTLLKTINDAVQINSQTDSFVLIEKDRLGASASKQIRIFPATLPPGQSIDRDGSSLTKQNDVCGKPEEDLDFDPIFLLKHDKPAQVDYGTDPNNHLMQFATKNSSRCVARSVCCCRSSHSRQTDC